MKGDGLIGELYRRRDELRESWRRVRGERLARRDGLLAAGMDIEQIRRDRIYRQLKKKQKGYTVFLKHLERRISRERARGGD